LLRFGEYLAQLKSVFRNTPSTEDVAGLLFNAIALPLDLKNKKGDPFDVTKETASNLMNRKIPVPRAIKNNSTSPKVLDSIYEYFDKSVCPQIIEGREDDLISGLSLHMKSDSSIANDTRARLIEKANIETLSIFLADVFLYTLTKDNKSSTGKVASSKSDTEFSTETTAEVLNKVDELLKKIPRPPDVQPTPEIQEHELMYIEALLLAYADDIGVLIADENELKKYAKYFEDLHDQRIDYFAAYSVKRGLLEYSNDGTTNQFDELKKEICDGIKPTAKKKYNTGYDKLLGVLEAAVSTTVYAYILNNSPYWINNKIKKGTCHFLVIDGKLAWVDK